MGEEERIQIPGTIREWPETPIPEGSSRVYSFHPQSLLNHVFRVRSPGTPAPLLAMMGSLLIARGGD